MANQDDPGRGWWQASDGKWYPPETHPDFQPPVERVALPAPTDQPRRDLSSEPSESAPAPAPRSASDTNGSPWWRQWWVLAATAALVTVVVGGVIVSTSNSGDEPPLAVRQPIDQPEPAADPTPAPDPSPTQTPAVEPTPTNVPESSNTGSRENPFAFGSPAAVTFVSFGDSNGSIWNVTISELRDLTSEVDDANAFNDPPPEGAVYAGFDVEMQLVLADDEPLAPGFSSDWEILGGTSAAVYQSSTLGDLLGCGVVGGEFDDFAEVFLGGTLQGTVCIPLPVEDLNDPTTAVALSFSDGERVVFAADGTPGEPLRQLGESQLGTNMATLGLGVEVPVTFTVFGDADRSVWNTTVSEMRDMTAEVAAANEFNDPPPDGVVFVGFEVEMTLASAEKEPLAAGFSFTWELLGGQTKVVYDMFTTADLSGCGAINDDFDEFAEVFVGGTIRGTVCIPLPSEDFGAQDTNVAMNFGGDRFVFTPDGRASPPVAVERTDGPAAIGDSYPVDEPIDISWESLGDADASVWTTELSPLRDITDQVVASNSFNDPPPGGVIFAGFDADLLLREATNEPLAVGFNFSWEILGGASRRVYTMTTFSNLFGCGAVPDAFDDFAEVLVGGTLTGTVCIPLPAEDLAHPDTRLALNFAGDRVTFLPRQDP